MNNGISTNSRCEAPPCTRRNNAALTDSRPSITWVRECLEALNLIADESHRTNASLQMLMREKRESLQKSLKRKTG